MQTLLSGTSGNVTGDAIPFSGGKAKICVWGTFGGATVMLQVQTSDGTWLNADGGDWTGGLSKSMSMPPSQIRMIVTGGTNAAIKAEISGY